jgi:hypothetical protein
MPGKSIVVYTHLVMGGTSRDARQDIPEDTILLLNPYLLHINKHCSFFRLQAAQLTDAVKSACLLPFLVLP